QSADERTFGYSELGDQVAAAHAQLPRMEREGTSQFVVRPSTKAGELPLQARVSPSELLLEDHEVVVVISTERLEELPRGVFVLLTMSQRKPAVRAQADQAVPLLRGAFQGLGEACGRSHAFIPGEAPGQEQRKASLWIGASAVDELTGSRESVVVRRRSPGIGGTLPALGFFDRRE